MNTTANYQLNQWEASDRVSREDFNADNQKIDAALAAVPHAASGVYYGTGTYGESSPNTLTFDFAPRAAFIMKVHNDRYGVLAMPRLSEGTQSHAYTTAMSPYNPIYYVWRGNTLTWYTENGVLDQFNENAEPYLWIAL